MTSNALAEDLPIPLLLIDKKRNAVSWSNIAARNLLQMSSRALQQRSLDSILPQVDQFADNVALTNGDSAGFVMRDVRINETLHDVTIYPAGCDVGVLIQSEGGSMLPQRPSDSIEVMGQMIGHELKNPLAGIKGAAQLLKADVTTQESRDLIALIVSEIDRIKRLTERLENFGQASGSTSCVNIHTLLRNARKIVAPGAEGVLFSEDYDPSLPHIEGDSDLLMQALVNLIKNAVEALGVSGGEVMLRTRSRNGARKNGRGLPIEIQICDEGPGLPKDMQDRIFDPFVTSKPSGQGLGLPLVAKIMEQHGGLVEVSSRPGNTRFSLLFPAALSNRKN